MAADLETYVVSIVATMVLAIIFQGAVTDLTIYPLLIAGSSIFASIVGSKFVSIATPKSSIEANILGTISNLLKIIAKTTATVDTAYVSNKSAAIPAHCPTLSAITVVSLDHLRVYFQLYQLSTPTHLHLW